MIQSRQFPYVGVVSWPVPQPQIDFVDQLETVGGWLRDHVGQEDLDWAWVPKEYVASWLCAVEFARERDRTLFLLRWDLAN